MGEGGDEYVFTCECVIGVPRKDRCPGFVDREKPECLCTPAQNRWNVVSLSLIVPKMRQEQRRYLSCMHNTITDVDEPGANMGARCNRHALIIGCEFSFFEIPCMTGVQIQACARKVGTTRLLPALCQLFSPLAQSRKPKARPSPQIAGACRPQERLKSAWYFTSSVWGCQMRRTSLSGAAVQRQCIARSASLRKQAALTYACTAFDRPPPSSSLRPCAALRAGGWKP